PLDGRTSFSIGVAVNPGAGDLELEVKKFQEKVNAGASFAITQAIYDPQVFLRFRQAVRDLPLPILVGVIPLKSHAFALYLHRNVPGIKIPEASLIRMARATKAEAKEVGLSIVLEVLEEIVSEVEGIHIMPIGDQESLGAILAWIAPRRQP
ncbi:MAG: methylenetetrahydrofolate reductase, partial [candidate division NC10 bacterium]|nr:methylenetetrahydrofolate reductase [candidate division NC10 bacterium]